MAAMDVEGEKTTPAAEKVPPDDTTMPSRMTFRDKLMGGAKAPSPKETKGR